MPCSTTATCLPLVVSLCAATAARAQGAVRPHLIATRLATPTQSTALLELDPTTGALTALPRFPLDALPPFAVGRDRFDGHPIVALDLGGTSRVVRLEPAGAGFVEHVLGDLPGPVVGLGADGENVVAGVADDGIWLLPRRGGTPSQVRAVPNLSDLYLHLDDAALVAWTGRPGTPTPDSGIEMVDLPTGQSLFGPLTWPNPTGATITAVADLPTGAFRQLLGFADGQFATHMAGTPSALATSPVVPPGGVVAFAHIGLVGGTVLALGGAAFPYLYDVDWWLGTVNLRSPALPGVPVDVVAGRSAFGDSFVMTAGCGTSPLHSTWSGLPSVGASLQLQANGAPGTPALLVAGLSDYGPTVPLPLPGGCRLEIAPAATAFFVLGPGGQATQTIVIPAGPAFHGVRLFTQWLSPDLVGIAASAAVVHHIGW